MAVAHVCINQNQPESELLLAANNGACLLPRPEFPVFLLTWAEPPSWSKATCLVFLWDVSLLRGHPRVGEALCRCLAEAVPFCGC